MKKITDKMRLNWLIKTGHRIVTYKGSWWIGTIGAWGETGTFIEGDAAYKNSPRKAIDAAMKPARARGKR